MIFTCRKKAAKKESNETESKVSNIDSSEALNNDANEALNNDANDVSNMELNEVSNEDSKSDSYMTNIQVEIDVVQSKINSLSNTSIHLCFLAALIGTAAFTIFSEIILNTVGFNAKDFAVNPSLVGIVSFIYIGIGYAFILGIKNREKQGLREELIASKSKLNVIRPIESDVAPTYFDRLVDINVSNLSDYYRMVKVHTDKSFFASLSAGVVGFILIVTGLFIGFTNFTNSESIAYLATGSGVIVEFISGVFFYLYNRTTLQLKGYHDSLVSIQNVLLSFKIIEDTTDSNAKLEMTKSMIASLNKTS